MNCSEIAELSPLYLSQELDAARMAGFARHLDACPSCAAEIARQMELDARVRDTVLGEKIDAAAVDRRVAGQITADSSIRHKWQWGFVAAGTAAVLLAGTLGYRTFLQPAIPSSCSDVAQDHRMEVVGRQPRVWRSDRGEIGALAVRLGISPSVVALAPVGYQLEHGKLCRLGGQVYLHMVYSDGAREMSLFLRQKDSSRLFGAKQDTVNGRDLYEADLGRQHVAYFETGQLASLAVADESPEAALSLARSAAAVL